MKIIIINESPKINKVTVNILHIIEKKLKKNVVDALYYIMLTKDSKLRGKL